MVWQRRRAGAALLAAMLVAALPAVAEEASLRVVLADGTARSFGVAELRQLPLQTAEARVREGAPFAVAGVSVTALLKAAGLDLSKNLGGAQVVGHALVARGADGYRAVFGLADVDPHFGKPPLLVLWANADGSPLRERDGPIQLVASGENRPGRWVRQLVSLEVHNMP